MLNICRYFTNICEKKMEKIFMKEELHIDIGNKNSPSLFFDILCYATKICTWFQTGPLIVLENIMSQTKLNCISEKYFRNLVKSNWNQIVYTIFRLIWNQKDIRMVPNQSENGKYNLISVLLKNTTKIFLCV